MDNANDYKLIISDKGQQAYADAIVEGLVEILIGKNQNLIKQKQDQEKEHE